MTTPLETCDRERLPPDHTDGGDDTGLSWVLLVEDDAVAARSTARLIANTSGLFVRLAENGTSAEHLLTSFGEPTAIVSDFALGSGGDGVLVIQRLRALGCRAPAAIFTGSPEAVLRALSVSNLTEVVPVFSKHDAGVGLGEWLEQLRLCWARSA